MRSVLAWELGCCVHPIEPLWIRAGNAAVAKARQNVHASMSKAYLYEPLELDPISVYGIVSVRVAACGKRRRMRGNGLTCDLSELPHG